MRARLTTVLGVLLADARQHAFQTLATCVGVAVGVAVIVAIQLSSNAALDRFRGTMKSFAGLATHELTSRGPLPASRLLSLLEQPAVRHAQPVVQSTLVLQFDMGGEPLPLPVSLVGTDPLFARPFLQLDDQTLDRAAGLGLFERLMTEQGLLVVARSTLDALGVPEGGHAIALGPHGPRPVVVVPLESPALAAADPPLALADIATAQELLGLGENLTRFDLILTDGSGPDSLTLTGDERVLRPARRGERASSMTAAFRSNLLCLGFLAVLVGAFLAFNMAQFAVVRRRALLGRLRCLGCPASEMARAVLLEAGLLGLLGSLLGLALGRLLARELVADVARTVSTLYGSISTPVPELDPLTAGLAVSVGVVSTLAACWGPARSAARTPPIAVAGQASREPLPPRWLPVALLAAAGLLLLPPASAVALPAAAVMALLLAVATGMPRLLGAVVRRSSRFHVLALALGRIDRTLGRTGAAAGALAMPLAMTIAILVMVGSFRAEVTSWSEAVLGADIYVQPAFQDLAPETARLSPELLSALDQLPGVLAVDRLRLTEELRGTSSFLVAGSPLFAPRSRGTMRVLDGGDLETLLRQLDAGDVLVSEPLARRQDIRPGDSLVLHPRGDPRSLRVAGVFQDFSWDRGYALLSEELYLQLYGDTGVRNAALLLEDTADAQRLVDQLQARFGDASFRTVERLRVAVLQAFNDTFAITYVLQAISTVLALVGILTALLCLHLERRVELGVLRALGARRRTLVGLLGWEALVLLGVASLVAVPAGLCLAWILVAVVNTRSFGWSFPMLVEFAPVLGLLGLAIASGLAAGLVPWWMVRRTSVAGLLQDRS